MTETQTVDLASWLSAVWDEEERLAKDAATHSGIYEPRWSVRDYPYEGISFWSDEEAGGFKDARTRHVELHDPASVLARIAADRKILAWCTEREQIYVGGPGDDPSDPKNYVPGARRGADSVVVRLLASPYKDLEGFQEAWL